MKLLPPHQDSFQDRAKNKASAANRSIGHYITSAFDYIKSAAKREYYERFTDEGRTERLHRRANKMREKADKRQKLRDAEKEYAQEKARYKNKTSSDRRFNAPPPRGQKPEAQKSSSSLGRRIHGAIGDGINALRRNVKRGTLVLLAIGAGLWYASRQGDIKETPVDRELIGLDKKKGELIIKSQDEYGHEKLDTVRGVFQKNYNPKLDTNVYMMHLQDNGLVRIENPDEYAHRHNTSVFREGAREITDWSRKDPYSYALMTDSKTYFTVYDAFRENNNQVTNIFVVNDPAQNGKLLDNLPGLRKNIP